MSVEDSLKILESLDAIQYDSETIGLDPHVGKLLSIQFGSKKLDIQIVVDCDTIDILKYKDILENKLLIGHNLKFDLQFLYNYGIVPLKVYDTMIIEQLLFLGYYSLRYNLAAVVKRRLNITLDKSIRAQIERRGLDEQVIIYAAYDVRDLEDIKEQQEKECQLKNCILAQKIENNFVPVIAYLEWCGIRLDVSKWTEIINKNYSIVCETTDKLNKIVLDLSEKYPNKFDNYQFIDRTLFGKECAINWNSPKQCIPLFEKLGFKLDVLDKDTHEMKKSLAENVLESQRGIHDELLDTFLKYKEAYKQYSTYGYTYIDSINPNTGRIHTEFKQLGADTSRMSCGDDTARNHDLAKLKGIDPSRCRYVALQTLPKEAEVRHCFIPEDDNLMTSCDYSAMESRLGANIYNEPAMIKEFLEGTGDLHSLTAKACFPKELEGIEVKDIKRLRPDLRDRAKPVEFSQQFGGTAKAIKDQLGCTMQEAQHIANNYNEGFKGIAKFKERGSKFVRKYGYVVICKKTGHKTYWEDFSKWKSIEEEPEEIRKLTYSKKELSEHSGAISKWAERKSLNSPTQGTGIIIMKYAMIRFFKWIVRNGYFGKILLCDLVHDEALVEFPKELVDIVPNKLKEFMENSASIFCEKLPIPAVPETGKFWIH
jgi:DNA polymerase I-like protein with 3'-5' exonuclease and polymerase domains